MLTFTVATKPFISALSTAFKAASAKTDFGAPKEARVGMRTGAVQFIVDQPIKGLHVQGTVMPLQLTETRVARWKA